MGIYDREFERGGRGRALAEKQVDLANDPSRVFLKSLASSGGQAIASTLGQMAVDAAKYKMFGGERKDDLADKTHVLAKRTQTESTHLKRMKEMKGFYDANPNKRAEMLKDPEFRKFMGLSPLAAKTKTKPKVGTAKPRRMMEKVLVTDPKDSAYEDGKLKPGYSIEPPKPAEARRGLFTGLGWDPKSEDFGYNMQTDTFKVYKEQEVSASPKPQPDVIDVGGESVSVSDGRGGRAVVNKNVYGEHMNSAETQAQETERGKGYRAAIKAAQADTKAIMDKAYDFSAIMNKAGAEAQLATLIRLYENAPDDGTKSVYATAVSTYPTDALREDSREVVRNFGRSGSVSGGGRPSRQTTNVLSSRDAEKALVRGTISIKRTQKSISEINNDIEKEEAKPKPDQAKLNKLRANKKDLEGKLERLSQSNRDANARSDIKYVLDDKGMLGLTVAEEDAGAAPQLEEGDVAAFATRLESKAGLDAHIGALRGAVITNAALDAIGAAKAKGDTATLSGLLYPYFVHGKGGIKIVPALRKKEKGASGSGGDKTPAIQAYKASHKDALNHVVFTDDIDGATKDKFITELFNQSTGPNGNPHLSDRVKVRKILNQAVKLWQKRTAGRTVKDVIKDALTATSYSK